MDNALSVLIRISNETGKDPALTQAAGGNTSVKTSDGKYMFIKASGTALKDMNAKRGWRKLRLDKLHGVINDKQLAKLPAARREQEIISRHLTYCCDGIASTARPSVEANLHALLDKCVIHLHPLVIGAYVNSKNGRKEITKLFKSEKYPPLWIPYAPPGFPLAIKTSRLITAYQKRYGQKPAIIFLAKHGLFVAAKNAPGAMRLLYKVLDRCENNLPGLKALRLKPPAARKIIAVKSAIQKAVLKTTGQYLPVTFIYNKIMAHFMNRPDAAKLLAMGPLEPAEMVYVNGTPMWVKTPSAEKIASGMRKIVRNGSKPISAFLVKGVGLFIAADKKNAPIVKDFATGTILVRLWASHFGGIIPLTSSEQNFVKRLYLAAPQPTKPRR
ncbi:MAG: class II aldolase/adducin family protein [Sedimentisphaerales bacterium]|jgi:rhamnose utilization protein RhaD (predicted bifunctional aldolase and dehydrogenase)